MLDNGLPGGREDNMDLPEPDETVSDGSLSEDIAALIDDSKTYVEAEVSYQKTRIALAVDRGKSGLIFGVCAAVIVHVALVALVIGLILALSPLITPWGATAVVVGLLLLAGAILGVKAKNRFARLSEVLADAKE